MLSALGGLSNFKLKQTRPSTPWVELNILSFSRDGRGKSPTVRMREIDGLRLHVPILEERDTLKIPQSSERLILSDQMNVMMLCGGYAGVHFTSEEMTHLISLASEFDRRFRVLEDFFNTLSSSQKNYIQKQPQQILPPLPPSNSNSNPDPDPDPEKFDDSTNISSPPPPLQFDDEALEFFHSAADSAIDILCQLQPLVKLKQTQVPSIEMIIADASSSDGDLPSSSEYLPRPKWLETLITKYISQAPPPPSSRPSNVPSAVSTSTVPVSFALPPVGSLAAFLSCCVTEQIDCTESEETALYELILASNDCNGRILQSSSDIRTEIFSHTQKYWANRFFQFLKKLTEFKSAVKDEKFLYDFRRFYNS